MTPLGCVTGTASAIGPSPPICHHPVPTGRRQASGSQFFSPAPIDSTRSGVAIGITLPVEPPRRNRQHQIDSSDGLGFTFILIPTLYSGSILVPTLCVGTGGGTLCVLSVSAATQSVGRCVPTQSVGTRKR